jgi:hypothetical protein
VSVGHRVCGNDGQRGDGCSAAGDQRRHDRTWRRSRRSSSCSSGGRGSCYNHRCWRRRCGYCCCLLLLLNVLLLLRGSQSSQTGIDLVVVGRIGIRVGGERRSGDRCTHICHRVVLMSMVGQHRGHRCDFPATTSFWVGLEGMEAARRGGGGAERGGESTNKGGKSPNASAKCSSIVHCLRVVFSPRACVSLSLRFPSPLPPLSAAWIPALALQQPDTARAGWPSAHPRQWDTKGGKTCTHVRCFV